MAHHHIMVSADTSNQAALPPEALRRALAALTRHTQCFWARRPGAALIDRSDLELIIRRLREYGDVAAWRTAREIEECL